MLTRKNLSRSTTADPAVPVIRRIQQLLASAGTPGTFATRHTAGIDDIYFDVVDVGAVQLPLSHRTAQKLCDVKTLLDPRVRDTWEIGKRQIKLDTRHWQRTLDPKLDLIARDLGLPDGVKLRAELHNLLVYGPGQFFAPHQDSEKADGMIGSLVVLLPSDSKGGALAIEHHDEKVSYRGSPNQLVLVAFYADCRHEVRPVASGYRAALTFNLFLDVAERRSERTTAPPVDALFDLVRDYFATQRPARGPLWPSSPAPERLVYLLDHEYTQKGLAWRALKNGDAVRASLLREVADRLDCEVVLALADVHETWSCEDDWGDDGRRRRGWYARYDGDEEDGDDGDEDYTLIELCNSDVELRHWVATSNKRVQAISDEVMDDEICFTKPSVDLEPFKSEHEGYTGNAGNTVDRWYHRAAVLLWPRVRTFAIRAKASPAWGIQEIAKALARRKAEVAKQRIGEMLPFWNSVAPREKAPGLADQILHVAHAIDDAQLATALVEPLGIEQMMLARRAPLRPRAAHDLARLAAGAERAAVYARRRGRRRARSPDRTRAMDVAERTARRLDQAPAVEPLAQDHRGRQPPARRLARCGGPRRRSRSPVDDRCSPRARAWLPDRRSARGVARRSAPRRRHARPRATARRLRAHAHRARGHTTSCAGRLVDHDAARVQVRAVRATRPVSSRRERAAIRVASRQGPARARPRNDHELRASRHPRDPADWQPVHAGPDQDTGLVHARRDRACDLDARSRVAAREREDAAEGACPTQMTGRS
ncbi:MAG: 2OG-Fe(II) oxygenase [Deltaproteobacteria bacterium]|nr:MAG: 2OG-Fe(II) oxygenase [Deltaproteobacteria bacterium]